MRTDGTVLGRAQSGPGNHILAGWEAASGAIRDAATGACAAAHIEPAAVAYACAGGSGVGPNGEGGEAIAMLLAERLPHARVRAVGDMVSAFAGALSTDCGVVVAAGTGAVCYGRNHTGEGRQVGGWGHLLGDEGSAYDIAVRALRAAARATDGRGPHTTLTQSIPQALGAGSFIEVAFRVYSGPMSRDAIAGLATLVAEAAAAGDPVASALLAEAGGDLALAAVTALHALGLDNAAVPVAYTGAVFDAGELVIGPFRHAIRAGCPRASVVAAEFPPVVGAFKLALQELGVPFTSQIEAALRAGGIEDGAA